MNSKTMKAKLKQLDQTAERVAELEKEFDMGNLAHHISQARVAITSKIGRKD
jgi:hypothetical protein